MTNDQILEAIGGKTVLELAELIEAFKTKFNVSVVAAAGPAAGGQNSGCYPSTSGNYNVYMMHVSDTATVSGSSGLTGTRYFWTNTLGTIYTQMTAPITDAVGTTAPAAGPLPLQ